MLQSIRVEVPTTSTSVSEILGRNARCNSIYLQAAKDNADDVLFGAQGAEVLFVVPGGSAGIDVMNTRDLYIVGTSGDYVSIALS